MHQRPSPTRGSSRISSGKMSSKGESKREGETFSTSISRDLYTITSIDTFGSISSSGSGLRHSSDGELPLKVASLLQNKLLSSLLEGYEYDCSTTEESAECGSGSWSGSQSTEYKPKETFSRLTVNSRGHASLDSSVAESTSLTTNESRGTESTSVLARGESDADLSALLKDSEDEVYETQSSSEASSENVTTGESDTYLSDGDTSGEEFYTRHNESSLGGYPDSEESETHTPPPIHRSRKASSKSPRNTVSQSAEFVGLTEVTSHTGRSVIYECDSPRNESDLATLSHTRVPAKADNKADNIGLKSCLITSCPPSNSRQKFMSSYSESDDYSADSEDESDDLTTCRPVGVAESSNPQSRHPSRHLPSTRSYREESGTSDSASASSGSLNPDSDGSDSESTGSRSVASAKTGNNTESTDYVVDQQDKTIPHSTYDPGKSESDSVRSVLEIGNKVSTSDPENFCSSEASIQRDRELNPVFLKFGKLTLENVQYIDSFEAASSVSDLSTLDQPISKEAASAVFTRRVVPVHIPAADQEDVSTLYADIQNDDSDEQRTIKHNIMYDPEIGLDKPTLKFSGKGNETISTYMFTQQRSKLELCFMGLIALSGITLVILLIILLSR